MEKIYRHPADGKPSDKARTSFGFRDEDTLTAQSLRDILSVRICAKLNVTAGTLIIEEDMWDDAMALAGNPDPQVAFRASWALEYAYTVKPGEVERRFDRFFADFITSGSESVQRVYSKMLCDMLRRGDVHLTEVQSEQAVERCFDLLSSPDTPIAVAVWQIELLYDMRHRFDWIEENLTETVRRISESPECTPGMAATVRRYFRRLGKNAANADRTCSVRKSRNL